MNAYLMEHDEDTFEQELNELYGTVDICGYTHDQGTLLRETDPTAFRCVMADHDEQWGCSNCAEVHEDEKDAEECCRQD